MQQITRMVKESFFMMKIFHEELSHKAEFKLVQKRVNC
jgi:hypothetical protein